MKFSGFFGIKNQFSDFFISVQVTWCNLERSINRDQRSKAGDDVAAHGASDHVIKSQSSDHLRRVGVGGGLTRRDHEVIDFTRSRVKNKALFTNLRN